MLLSCHQNAGQNHNVNVANRYLKNVAKFRHLGTTVNIKILYQEKIKQGLDLGNACYHSVQNLLSSCILSKNKKLQYRKL
jgi:predicted RNA-binding protein with RPS1 domain